MCKKQGCFERTDMSYKDATFGGADQVKPIPKTPVSPVQAGLVPPPPPPIPPSIAMNTSLDEEPVIVEDAIVEDEIKLGSQVLLDDLDALEDAEDLEVIDDFDDFDIEDDDLADLVDDEEFACGKSAAIPTQITDALKEKQSRISAVSYILSSGEPIDYSKWSFLAMQLRYFDRLELMRLTAALMPKTSDWEDDGRSFNFSAAGTPCHINIMSSTFTVTADIGSLYPTDKPGELSAELKLAKTFFERERARDREGAKEAGKCLFEIGGHTELQHRRTEVSAFDPIHVPDREYYAHELKKAERHLATKNALYKHSKIDNPVSIAHAKKAHAALSDLFPDDMMHFAYNWQGVHDGSWSYFDALIEQFDMSNE